MSNSSSSSGGVTFAGLLTVAFVVLKLTSVISWSWWWVLSPAWMPLALFIVIALGIILLGIISTVLDEIKFGKKKKK